MNHELAKKLKDAGFPFDHLGQCKNCGGFEGEYIPTFSELIEACGNDSVIVLTIGKVRTTALHGKTGLASNGSTPEEAVANLWLELNKK